LLVIDGWPGYVRQKMLLRKTSLAVVGFSLFTGALLFASTPEQEKAFVEAYKKAFAAKDEKALRAFLYTKGAHPMALEFYSMVITDGAGTKNATMELLDLTPDEVKKAAEVGEGPDGTKAKLPLKPTKRLVIKISTAEGGNTSTSTSQFFVAEADGKLVVPVPVPAK
jgi:hypothetical protein